MALSPIRKNLIGGMKNNKMKKIAIKTIVTLLLSSCNSNIENPMLDFKIGESSEQWKEKVSINLEKGKITDEYYDTYRYYFRNGKDSIYSDVEFNSDGYKFEKLRIINYNLKADKKTKYSGTVRSFYPRKKIVIDELFSWFIELYGTPNDTILNYGKQFNFKNKTKSLQSINYRWKKEQFDIDFFLETRFIFNDSLEKEYYSNSSIVFKSKSYKSDLEVIKDSIRNTLGPNDIVKVNFKNLIWESKGNNNYNFTIVIEYIYRGDYEEPRSVTNIEFDLIITDIFENEITRLSGIRLQLNPVLKQKKRTDIFLTIENSFNLDYNYNAYSSNIDVINIEKARKEKIKLGIKYFAIVKSIIFDDGTVKKNE